MSYPIKDYMTKAPQTIGSDIPLSKAIDFMRDCGVRHLPVQSRAKLVGVISERDINLALSIHPSATDLKVEDVMIEEPYCVSSNTPLEEVAHEMAKNKYGSAIVVNEADRAIGIFTSVDALSLLAERIGTPSLEDYVL